MHSAIRSLMLPVMFATSYLANTRTGVPSSAQSSSSSGVLPISRSSDANAARIRGGVDVVNVTPSPPRR